MEKDLDIKLYYKYLEGEKGAFELLYNKYRDKIQYFIYNIVKDYQKAEDITQDVFIYVMQNRIKEGYTFKYYIYLVAKSRAFNQINMEKRRTELNEEYILIGTEQVGQDVADIVADNEKRKTIISAIDMLDDRYKNAIYLVKFEEFTYQETAQILGESVQNVKNLIHRGKKELRKILIKKGVNEMNKASKMFIMVLCLILVVGGITYATIQISEGMRKKVSLTPIFSNDNSANFKDDNTLNKINANKVWVGSFQIAWNEFMSKIVGREIKFVDTKSILVEELNKQLFTKEMLSDKDYYIKLGSTSRELKNEILSEINKKFGISSSSALEKIDFEDDSNGRSYTIYSVLYKTFNFLKPFDKYLSAPFNDSETRVKYFGIMNSSSEELNDNVEVLFYNSREDFAVKLKTKENEEVILYTDNSQKPFSDLYNEIIQKQKSYKGKHYFTEMDQLKVPYIEINTIVNYDELCGKEIEGTDGLYIQNAVQNVKFSLDETGGNLVSEATIKDMYLSLNDEIRFFYYTSPFIVFLKEENKDKPYFALKVDNTDILVNGGENELEELMDSYKNN